MSFGLTWMDWAAFTIEDTNSPYADTPGAGAMSPTHFIPLAGEETLAYNPNQMYSPTVERVWAPMKTQKGATVVGGTLTTVIPIHMFGGATEGRFYDWGVRRYSVWPSTATDANQCAAATLWVCVSNMDIPVVKKITGAKVARITIESAAGSNWVSMSLDIIGREMTRTIVADPTTAVILEEIYGVANTVVPEYCHLDSTMWTGERMHVWNDNNVTQGWGNNKSLDADALSWSLVIDNKIHEDGHRLDRSGKLRRLTNGDREVTGSVNKDFRKNDDFDAFLAGTEIHLAHFLYRGASDYLSFEIPRAVHDSGGVQSGGDRSSYNQENYSWRALGALGDETIQGSPEEGAIAIGQEIYINEASS